MGMQSWG